MFFGIAMAEPKSKAELFRRQLNFECRGPVIGPLVAAILLLTIPLGRELTSAEAAELAHEQSLPPSETLAAPPAEPSTTTALPNEGDEPEPVSVQAPVASTFRLGIGDRLRMRFYDRYDRADLDGEYIVTDGGLVRLPRIGDFVALDKSIPDLEHDIQTAIEKRGEKFGYFSVERTQIRPFYVAGLANHPGVFAFTPGLTVLHAVALAGGIYRSAALNPADGIRENGRRTETLERLKVLLAKRARLEAQREGLNTINVPTELTAIDPIGADGLIAKEQDLLQRYLQLTKSKRSSLEDLVMRTKEEADSYVEGLKSITNRIAEHTKAFDQLRELHDRNIINQQRYLEAVVALDNAERDKQQMISNLAHTNVALERAKSDLSMLNQVEDVRISKELSDVEFEIVRTKADIEKSSKILGALHDLGGEGGVVSYRIMRRRGDGEYSFVEATERTPIEPGDVVQIERVESQTQSLN
jgi:protein involved in polysaccharide export with SLBB domain